MTDQISTRIRPVSSTEDYVSLAKALISVHDLPNVSIYSKDEPRSIQEFLDSFQSFIDIDKRIINNPTHRGEIVSDRMFDYLQAVSSRSKIKHTHAIIMRITVAPHDFILRLHVKGLLVPNK